MPGLLSELEQAYYNANPDAAYQYWFAPFLGKNNPFGKWLGDEYEDYYGQYKAQVGTAPNLQFLDFLAGVNPQQEWNAMAPSQRGERSAQYSPQLMWKNLFGGAMPGGNGR